MLVKKLFYPLVFVEPLGDALLETDACTNTTSSEEGLDSLLSTSP